MPRIEKIQISELKKQFPRLYIHRAKDDGIGDIVYRGLNKMEVDLHQEKTFDTQADANRSIAETTVVFPVMGQFQQIIEEFPLLPGTLSVLIQEASGLELAAKVEKL